MKSAYAFLVLFLLLLQFSCSEKKKEKPDTTIKYKGLELLNDFETNYNKFHQDTMEIGTYSNYKDQLIINYTKDRNYTVLDFTLNANDHNLLLTYWVDNRFNIKLSRSIAQYLNQENKFEKDGNTFAEITHFDTYYLSYADSSLTLYDKDKQLMNDQYLAQQQKARTEQFFYELIELDALQIMRIAKSDVVE